MLVTADWVVPISRPPIRDGAVLIEHGVIAQIGRLCDFGSLAETVPTRVDLPGCTVMPGLVNAHTHLSLTAMEGLLEPADFEVWLPRLVSAMRAWEPGDYAASATLGARRCLEAGVTVVGDIVYGPEGAAVAADAGLGGTFYWELLGLKAPQLYAELERLEFPAGAEGACGTRVRCGLSPHSAYTSGPGFLRAVHAAAEELSLPVAIHVAESRAEFDLLMHGTGPLADVAARLAPDFEVPGMTPVCYLDRLGVMDGATAVHLCHVSPTDISRLSATIRGAVTCPRSNAFLGNAHPPIGRLLAHALPVGVGTDSAASNHDLDLMSEVRAIHEIDPSIPTSTLLQMATLMGAVALGVEDRFGVLETGMQGDLAAFRLGETIEPEADLVKRAGRDTLAAVCTAGKWRVREGELVAGPDIDSSAEKARARAAEALKSS